MFACDIVPGSPLMLQLVSTRAGGGRGGGEGELGWTHRWLRVVKGDSSRLCEWTEPDWEAYRNHSLNRRNHGRMPRMLLVSPDVSMPTETESHTLAITDLTKEPKEPVRGESPCERGGRQGWTQWRGCRMAQAASTALTGVIFFFFKKKTSSAKRGRHQIAVRRRVLTSCQAS